jgi:hypothetical protein
VYFSTGLARTLRAYSIAPTALRALRRTIAVSSRHRIGIGLYPLASPVPASVALAMGIEYLSDTLIDERMLVLTESDVLADSRKNCLLSQADIYSGPGKFSRVESNYSMYRMVDQLNEPIKHLLSIGRALR